MQVIVEKPFARYSAGAVIPDMPANQARALIARGLVREAEEKNIVRATVDRMIRRKVEKA